MRKKVQNSGTTYEYSNALMNIQKIGTLAMLFSDRLLVVMRLCTLAVQKTPNEVFDSPVLFGGDD